MPSLPSPVCASSRMSSAPRASSSPLERHEVARRHLDHAARADERLGDDRGEVVRALAVEQVEGDREQRPPPVLALRAHRRAVGVGRGDRVEVRNRRPVAPGGRGEAHGAGHVGVAVKAQVQRADAAAPGGAAGEEHRRLVGIGARLDEERAAERGVEGLREARGETELRRVEVDRARMGQRAEALAHGCGHARVVVAQRRAHLARVEVEVGPAVGVEDLGAVCADEDGSVGRRHHVRQQLALDQMTRAGGAQGRDVHLVLPREFDRRDPSLRVPSGHGPRLRARSTSPRAGARGALATRRLPRTVPEHTTGLRPIGSW